MVEKLGELLVRERLITAEQLIKALDEKGQSGGRLGTALIRLGYVSEATLITFLSIQFGVPAVDPSKAKIDQMVIDAIPAEVARKYHVMPVGRQGATLTVATSDPTNIFVFDDIKFLTGKNIIVNVASERAIKEAINRYYDNSDSFAEVMEGFKDEGIEYVQGNEEVAAGDSKNEAEEAPVVKLVNLILTDAMKKNASDIHVEPYEKIFRVRYRIDGVLYEVMKPPIKLKNAIVSRIKIMSKLDIAERRLPQDGRIKLKRGSQEMDFRVSSLPTLFGEKVVLRLLDKSNLQLDMTKLGFEQKQLDHFLEAIHRPFGMVLVTGPTGSGKTTTLYSALTELNKVSENISTAEDPVEFNLMGINQVQMHEDIGLTFASALRSFLRQDPDIIMVGEIRDFETAEIAIKAALTGHMVLSTLHTNDAPSTVNRLLNMGVEPFLVASSVNLIVAQRLARKICLECKAPIEISPQALLELGVPEELVGTRLYQGKGCPNCSGTGYKGRIALYEVMVMDEELRELVIMGASTSEILRAATRLGMKTLRRSAIARMLEGTTSYREVIRCTIKDTQ
ncbi:MAG: type IV-A pilus assembly ATPase PilB [Pseudomonadota bacterium]